MIPSAIASTVSKAPFRLSALKTYASSSSRAWRVSAISPSTPASSRSICQRAGTRTLLEARASPQSTTTRQWQWQRKCYSQLPGSQRPMGVFTPLSAALFVGAGVGLYFYFRYEKQRLQEEREKERGLKSYGRPRIGGPFSLTDQDGKPFTQDDLLGKWSLVYFGFTNCPDICPAELDKVTEVLNRVQKTHGDIFLPVFISVDPARDPPSRIKQYLQDFHPSFIGLVGNYDTTKQICKAYRVYFSTPPNADPNGDYLVDHSIFVYLMDPEGQFVEAVGQAVQAEDVEKKIGEVIEEWKSEHGGRKV